MSEYIRKAVPADEVSKRLVRGEDVAAFSAGASFFCVFSCGIRISVVLIKGKWVG